MAKAHQPRLLMAFVAEDADAQFLACALKTLEINAPSVPYTLVVIAREPQTREQPTSLPLDEVVGWCSGVELWRYNGTLGSALNTRLVDSGSDYLMVVHPDICFLAEDWCDMLLSIMLRREMALLGPQPFAQWTGERSAMQATGEWLLAAQGRWVREADGWPDTVDGLGWSCALQARMRRRGMHVAGGDIQRFFGHMGRCSADTTGPSDWLKRVIDQELEAMK